MAKEESGGLKPERNTTRLENIAEIHQEEVQMNQKPA